MIILLTYGLRFNTLISYAKYVKSTIQHVFFTRILTITQNETL